MNRLTAGNCCEVVRDELLGLLPGDPEFLGEAERRAAVDQAELDGLDPVTLVL